MRGRSDFVRGIFYPAHLGVEEIADRFELLETFERHLRPGAAAGSLDQNLGETEPALDHIGADMDILDAGVVDDDLPPKENAPAHRDALVGEFVPHRVVTKIEIRREHGE